MTVRILILGTGHMANRHAESFAGNPACKVVAAVDVAPGRLDEFARAHRVAHTFASLDEALAWGEFDAAANVTPDSVHRATTLRLLAAGKHVFCEKPLAETHPETVEMVEAAARSGLVNMVNLRFRGLPEVDMAARLVADGVIGEVRHVHAAYLQSWLVGNHWGDWRTEPRWLWRLSRRHGSKGVLGDIGIHILDSATFVAGLVPTSLSCRLASFHKAEGDRIGEYGLDVNDSFVMSLAFDGGAIGAVHASRFATGYANAKKIDVFGTRGGLEVRFEKEVSSLRVCTGDDVHAQNWRTVRCPKAPLTYDRFVEAVATGRNAQPDFARAAALQKLLDLGFVSDADGTSHRA